MPPTKVAWEGVLSFGLINIPVGLAPATEASSKASNVSFKRVHKTCKTPIKLKTWCPKHDVELEPDEVAKGWEQVKGEPLVLVDDQQLRAIEADASRAMEIQSYVDLAAIPAICFDRSYYLVPRGDSQRGYSIFMQTLDELGAGAICRFVRAGQEKWGFVSSYGDVLVMQTLFLDEDMRNVEGVELDATKAEIKLASQLIQIEEFDPGMLVSEYRQDLHALLSDTKPKRKEKKSTVKESTTEMLRASVAAIKKQKKAA